MILRYPPQQTNSSSCSSSLFPSQFDSPFPVMNSNTSNNNNFRLSFIHHHSTDQIENENNASLMNDEPCTPCSSWLSLTTLNQLSFNSNNNLNPNCSTYCPESSSIMTNSSSTTTTTNTTTSCTISFSNVEPQMPPPPSFQFSIPSSSISAKDLFEEEFRSKCSKYRKVNEATRSVSSLTPCSTSSSKSMDSNDKSSQDIESSTINTNECINTATATIVSKVLSNVLSKSIEMRQKKIQKKSGFKRQDIPRLVIPSDQSSAIFVKHCSLQDGKKQ